MSTNFQPHNVACTGLGWGGGGGGVRGVGV